MKRYILASVILVLSVLMIFISCKKENGDETSIDKTPALSFMTGFDYISSNTTLEVSMAFKVGVQGSKNPNTNNAIETFKVIRNFNGIIETVYENKDVGESSISWESNERAISVEGEEKWTFIIRDYTGYIKEISFVITTVGQGTYSPLILFMEGENYISHDVTLDTSSVFKVGINAFSNPNTDINLLHFEIVRTCQSIPIIVFQELYIDSNSYSWEGEFTSINAEGSEELTFTIFDQSHDHKSSEVSLIVTTTIETPQYIPVFSPTYLIVNQSGVEFLDFYLTCVTDDWEMIRIIVTYPGGLGTDEYIGNGQIITQGSPFTFSNYFVKLSGTWTFSILGEIKSGIHENESFISYCTVTVAGK